MLDSFKLKFFHKDFEPGRKCFYLGTFASFLMLSVLSVLAVVVRYSIMPVFTLVMGVILVMAIFYFAQVTGRYGICSVAVLFVVNMVILPVVYVQRGMVVSAVGIFFVLGTLLCVVMLEEPFMYVAAVLSVMVFTGVQYYVYKYTEFVFYRSEAAAGTLVEVIISVLLCGLMSGLCVRYRIAIYSAEKEKAEAARRIALNTDEAKNVFLSNMSHEMRTPMNAILGISQLLQEEDIDEDSKSEVTNVINACNALLFTVEDLLDFSYQVGGRFPIHENRYSFYSLIDDVVNMSTISMMDKGVELLTGVDKGCPELLGDEKRLRQVMIYILANCIRRCSSGHISLDACYAQAGSEEVILDISIKDSGAPIDRMELKRLQDDQSPSDTVRAPGMTYAANVAGRDSLFNNDVFGLGFCRDILESMGGTLGYECDEEGVNSFAIRIFQKVGERSIKEMHVDKGGAALVFEKGAPESESLKKALGDCGITCSITESAAAFREAFERGEWDFAFLDYNNFMGLREYLGRYSGKCRLVVLTDIIRSGIIGCPGTILIRPAYYNNIRALIDRKEHPSLRRITLSGDVRFPGIRAMAVDDNITNLNVIMALLKKYDMEVYVASGGRECLNRLSTTQVDIIFLDYMMPEMDGIDTLKNIRAMNEPWVKDVPVVALTANAVEGVREMLLEAGFDDYLTKPVEIKKLERCIGRFTG